MKIKLKGIIEEDFLNFYLPSLTLIFPYCDFKCDKESGLKICQNSELAKAPNREVDIEFLVDKYLLNPITKSVVCSGLEPFDSYEELKDFIKYFRTFISEDIIVIYTGYTEKEVQKNSKFNWIFLEQNIIIKFGRFLPNHKKHYDRILGVNLASDNQYAKKI